MDPDTKYFEKLLSLGRFGVTSLVTLILVPVFAWGFLSGKIDHQVFTQTVGMVLAFWFGAATSARSSSAPPSASTTTTDTNPTTGVTRKVTQVAPPGAPAPTSDPPKGVTP